MIGLSICKQNYVSTAISKKASDMPRKLAVAHITQVVYYVVITTLILVSSPLSLFSLRPWVVLLDIVLT